MLDALTRRKFGKHKMSITARDDTLYNIIVVQTAGIVILAGLFIYKILWFDEEQTEHV